VKEDNGVAVQSGIRDRLDQYEIVVTGVGHNSTAAAAVGQFNGDTCPGFSFDDNDDDNNCNGLNEYSIRRKYG
jgi:hypothetical protein